MSDNLDNLRKIAEAATPGPWTVMDVNDPGEGVNFIDVHQDGKSWEVVSRRLPDRHDDRDQMSADATHIATFDPPAVLALLSRLEQAEQAAARVRELHPITFYDKWGRTSLEPVGHGGWCSNCGRFDGDSCETIRALDGDTRD